MPLFRGDVYAGIRAAKAKEQMSIVDVRVGKSEIITTVKKTYYQILLLHEQKNLVEQSMARILKP